MSRRLLVSYLALTIVLLAALEIPLAASNNDRLRTHLTSNLVGDAYSMADYVEATVEGRADVDLGLLARNYEERTGARVVIVDRTGRTLADSHPEATSETFASRPEIAAALGGTVATGTRRSDTLDADLLYVAVPLATSQGIEGALRITYSTAQIDARRRDYLVTLSGVAAVSLLVATLLGLLLARWVTRPVRRLERAAAVLGAGDLRVRADDASGPPELRELAHTFNEMADRLDGLMASQAAFVADASHQLRSPLAALQLRLENLQADVAEAAAAEPPGGPDVPGPSGASPSAASGVTAPAGRELWTEDVEAALAESARLARIVDALLVLARADRATTGEGAPPPTTLGLDRAFTERLEVWSAIAEAHGARLEAEPGGLRVAAAADALTQVLDNLLANAIDASPPGGVVRLSAETVPGAAPPVDARAGVPLVEVHVVDEGPGLTPEERDRAFDRFWRAHPVKSDLSGTGLGLPIARQLARSMDGDVELREAPGGGVDAVVLLPLAPAPDPAAPAGPAAPGSGAATAATASTAPGA